MALVLAKVIMPSVIVASGCFCVTSYCIVFLACAQFQALFKQISSMAMPAGLILARQELDLCSKSWWNSLESATESISSS